LKLDLAAEVQETLVITASVRSGRGLIFSPARVGCALVCPQVACPNREPPVISGDTIRIAFDYTGKKLDTSGAQGQLREFY